MVYHRPRPVDFAVVEYNMVDRDSKQNEMNTKSMARIALRCGNYDTYRSLTKTYKKKVKLVKLKPIPTTPKTRHRQINRKINLVQKNIDELTPSNISIRLWEPQTFESEHGFETKVFESFEQYKPILHPVKSLDNLKSLDTKTITKSASMNQESPRYSYSSKCDDLQICPEKLRELALKGRNAKNLDLRYFGIGEKQACALSAAVIHLPKIEYVNLKENRLTNPAIYSLTEQFAFCTNLKILDLSSNSLTVASISGICKLIKDSSSLHTLILNNTMIKSSSLKLLCDTLKLKKSSQLQSLHLSHNNIDSHGASFIGEMLAVNKKLKSLNLSWNQFSHGARDLLLGLQQNRKIENVDLSWNILGSIAEVLSQTLRDNKTIVHLDLSFNNMSSEQCSIIAKGLANNTTILGLHLEGNAYRMASDGQMVKRAKNDLAYAHSTRSWSKPSSMWQSDNMRSCVVDKNCWICGKWSEIKIEFLDTKTQNNYLAEEKEKEEMYQNQLREKGERMQSKLKSNPYKQRVFETKIKKVETKLPDPLSITVHLNCDKFRRPRRLNYIADEFRYQIYVVVPAGTLEYYFTVNGTTRVLAPTLESNKATLNSQMAFEKSIQKSKNKKKPMPWMGNAKPGIEPSVLKLHRLEIIPSAVSNSTKDSKVKPRLSCTSICIINDEKPFTNSDSVFLSAKTNHKQLRAKSFQADIGYCKLYRLFEEPSLVEDLKNAIYERYETLCEIFKTCCANSTTSRITSLSFNDFVTFCGKWNDTTVFGVTDIENVFIAANIHFKSSEEEDYVVIPTNCRQNNPDRELSRYEFLEAIGRLAVHCFKASKSDSPGNALRSLLDKQVLPKFPFEYSNVFREKKLYCASTDKVVRNNKNRVDSIFSKLAVGKRVSFESWSGLCSFLREEQIITALDIQHSFRLSMDDVVDEITSKTFGFLSLPEFIEAICRLAHFSDSDKLNSFYKKQFPEEETMKHESFEMKLLFILVLVYKK